MKLRHTALLASVILALSACSSNQNNEVDQKEVKAVQTSTTTNQKTSTTTSIDTLTENEFTIVAKEATHQLNSEVSVEAWTFNGSVPGSQIRITEGEKVKITLKNELP